MTLSPCYRAACDAPLCPVATMSPHARTGNVRRQLDALGWVLLRWRPNLSRSGPGRLLTLCPRHRAWRPRRGGAVRV